MKNWNMECQIIKGEKAGTIEEIEDNEEVKRYNLGVFGVNETVWKGSGSKSVDDCYVVFPGISDGQARAGVAEFLTEKMSKCVKG